MRYTRRQVGLFNGIAVRSEDLDRANRIEEALAARLGGAAKLAQRLRS